MCSSTGGGGGGLVEDAIDWNRERLTGHCYIKENTLKLSLNTTKTNKISLFIIYCN